MTQRLATRHLGCDSSLGENMKYSEWNERNKDYEEALKKMRLENPNAECKKSPTGKHIWVTQTAADEDRTLPRGDWGLIIGTFCNYCEKRKA
jgi:hypothetical protein